MRPAAIAFGAALACSLAPVAAGRATVCDQWTGATSHDWNVASNWSAGVPGAHSAVCISVGAQRRRVDVGGAARAATVSLSSGMELVLGTHGSLRAVKVLRVYGSLTFVAATSSISTPRAVIARHGRMFGIGKVHGNVVNAGTVFAADGGSRTPLRISGSYRQLSSGLLFSRDEAGHFVALDARSACLRGRLTLLILDALAPGSKYPIVRAQTMSGRFAHVPPGYVMRYADGVATAIVTPQIRLGRSIVQAGTRVAVFGASFGYLGIVRLYLDSRSGPLLGTANVNSVGGFEGIPRIPASTPPGPHVLVAVRPPFGYTAKALFRVTAR